MCVTPAPSNQNTEADGLYMSCVGHSFYSTSVIKPHVTNLLLTPEFTPSEPEMKMLNVTFNNNK